MCKCGNISSCASDCGCKFEVDAGCVRYSGVSLDSINIVQGDVLETIITNISEVITNNGINTRITVAEEPAGDNCAFGGTRISVVDKDTNEVIETQYVCASGNASVFELITYEELKTKIETSELDPGKLYKITDFQTIYDQPSYITGGDDLDPNVETKYADIDPIIVTATSSNTLDTFASQPGNPNDIIRYEVYYTLPFNTGTPTKGRITYRKDNKGNECSWDFRTILFKRWTNGYNIDFFDNGGTLDEDTVFGTYTAFNNRILFDNTTIPFINDPLNQMNPNSQLFDLPNIRIIVEEYCQGLDITGCIRNVTLSAKKIDNITSRDKLINTRVLSIINEFNSKIVDNVFENFYNVDIIAVNISGNKFLNEHKNLIISNYGEHALEIINNKIYKSYSSNISTQIFIDNTFEAITASSLLGSTTSGSLIKNNKVGYFRGNSVEFSLILNNDIKEFVAVTATTSSDFTFTNNQIQVFSDISIDNATNFSDNSIIYFEDCNISSIFSENRFSVISGCSSIGTSFLNNTGVLFKTNIVGYDCRNNNFGPDFSSNTVSNYFGFNGYSSSLSANVFKSQTSNCTFGEYMADNTFNSNLYSCTFDDYFTKNEVKTELQSIDFSSATHVYSNYNCKMYKNSADVNRLAYYDSFDSEQTVNITD
jgi:hypothetical protein